MSNDRCILGIWFGWRSVAPRNAQARFFLLLFFLYKGKVHFGDTFEACDLADFNQRVFFLLVFLFFASASAYINVNGAVTEL